MGLKITKKVIFSIFLIIILAIPAFGATRYLLVAPGETWNPAGVKGGAPNPQTSGVPFNVTVYAINDLTNEPVNTSASDLDLSASQTVAYSPDPTTVNLSSPNSSATPVLNSKKIIQATISSAVVNGAVGLYANNLPTSVGIQPGSVTITTQKINQFTFCALTTNKTAGTSFNISVTAQDSGAAAVTSFYGIASLTAVYGGQNITVNLGNVTFTAGVAVNVPVVLYDATAAGQKVTFYCSYPALSLTSPSTAGGFSVDANASSPRLLIIGPGQTYLPGTATGNGRVSVSEAMTQRTAGTPFSVNIIACDAYWNTNTAITGNVSITSADPQFTPVVVALSSGVATTTITLKTVGAGAQNITVSHVPAIAADDIDTAPMTFSTIDHFKVVNTISTVNTEQEITALVSARDLYENTVTSYAGPVDVSVYTGGYPGGTLLSTDKWDFSGGTFNGISGIASIRLYIFKKVFSAAILVADDSDSNKKGATNSFDVLAGTLSKILLLAPGDAHDAGSKTTFGKVPGADAQTVGQDFTFDVYATDYFGNIIDTVTDNVVIDSSDLSATVNSSPVPFTIALAEGKSQCHFIFRTFSVGVGTRTISAADSTNPGIVSGNSNDYTDTISVSAGNVAYFEIGGMPSSRAAGASFNPVIRARDQFGNVKTDYTGVVYVSSNLDYTLPNASTIDVTSTASVQDTTGQYSYKWAVTFTAQGERADLIARFYRAGTQTAQLFVSDSFNDTPNMVSFTGHVGFSSFVTVTAGSTPKKFQVIVPGVTARPGTTLGETGTPTGQGISQNFTVRVNMCDDYYNVVTTATQQFTVTTSNNGNSNIDGTGSLPTTRNLSSGTRTFTIKCGSPSNSYIITASTNASGIASDTSQPVSIFDVYGFMITTTSGGPIGAQTAGVPFMVSITAVDSNGQILMGFNNFDVNLAASNNYPDLPCIYPVKSPLFTKGLAVFEVTMYRASQSTPIWMGGQITFSVAFGNMTPIPSNSFNLVPAAPKGTLIIFEGMEHMPGISPFADGIQASDIKGYDINKNPKYVMAGTNSTMNVMIVDEFFNRCFNLGSNSVTISSSDPRASLGGIDLSRTVSLTAGGAIFSDMVLKTVGTTGLRTVTADGGYANNFTTDPIHVYHNDTLHHFTVDAPVTPVTAGEPFNIVVKAMDEWDNVHDNGWNVGKPFSKPITLQCQTGANTMSPTAYALVNGEATISTKIFKGGEFEAYITANFGTPNGRSADIATVANVFKGCS